MDIATVFELLSQGKIISINSKEYKEYAKFLQDDEVFEKFQNSLNTIGYTLNGESGYFYLSKTRAMKKEEMEAYLKKHKDIILAISILRQLYPQIDRGSEIKYTEFIKEYEAHKMENSSIQDRLNIFTSGKANSDLRSKIDIFFNRLVKFNIIEEIDNRDKNLYRVLNAIDYYIKIIELVEEE